jgi:hypothetical protein
MLFSGFAMDRNGYCAEKMCETDQGMGADSESRGWREAGAVELEVRSTRPTRLTWGQLLRSLATDDMASRAYDGHVIGSSFLDWNVRSVNLRADQADPDGVPNSELGFI